MNKRLAVAPRSKLAGDLHRPQYHFLPPENWMNDPNGLIQWEGLYHLFYQCNPTSPTLARNPEWGHAVSEDLLHWRDLPLAMPSDPKAKPKEGYWSGCAVNDHGVPSILYTEYRDSHQMVSLSTSEGDLMNWARDPRSPVIPAPPAGMNITDFRDPYVFQDEKGSWIMVLGGIVDGRGAVISYKSADLRSWDYHGPLLTDREHALGPMWECPNLFKLDSGYVLTISVGDRAVYYFIGDYDGERFLPLKFGKVDYGKGYYASQVFRDQRGRLLSLAWLMEDRSPQAQASAGWSGVLSLPRLVRLSSDDSLVSGPIEEMKQLRGDDFHIQNVTIPPASEIALPVEGSSLEIQAEFEFSPSCHGLKLCCSPDEREETFVGYDFLTQQVFVDRQQSSLSPEVNRGIVKTAYRQKEHEPLRLHLFLDRSVMEVFVDNAIAITTRLYPTRPDSLGIGAFARQGAVTIKSLDIWKMKSIWTS
ncbi:MAG: glycoside hydrolase family 32 protein [Anaerolineales bacterium]